MARTQTTILNSKTKQNIILLLLKKNEIGITEFSNKLNLAKSTLWEHLMWLVKEDYLIKNNKGKYSIQIIDNIFYIVDPKIKQLEKELKYWKQFGYTNNLKNEI